jgi:carbonic anhydrase/acetyltransferase-like protein (isoleucine patch superfamily)
MNENKEILFDGNKPNLHEKSYVADGAKVIGDVTLGEYGSIWYNAVVRGDVNKITIGRYTNIQDNAVLHVAEDYSCDIGDFVTVGHGAILHACKVEDYCLIGMGAVVLDGAVIGQGSIIAAGAVVTPRTKIPPFSLVTGVPGKAVKQLPEETKAAQKAHAIKYKSLWCEGYGIMPNNNGEE